MVTDERWSEVRQHFLHLADKSPSHRQDYLDLVCENDRELRYEVEALLKAHDSLGATVVDQSVDEHLSIERNAKLGAYTVFARLGQGAAGAVYHAHHPDFGEVALKLQPAASIADATARARFEREAAVLKRLEHPSLCVVYDVFVTSRFAGIAMQRVKGVSLRERLLEGPLTYGAALAIVRNLLAALSITHAAGIVHRDIKPANVMLDADQHPILIDFGIARDQGAPLTRTGQTLGSPRYMSPEQWRGSKVDARSDQFSLGLLWYEMLTGKPAFDATSLGDIANQVLYENPSALPAQSVDGRALDLVVPVLQKMLIKAAAHRYADVKTLLAVIDQNAYSKPMSK